MPRKVDRSCDFFVVFGITGDLARVMTFHSLYRLEEGGLLDCPIVGVAVDAWSDKDLREPRNSNKPKPDELVIKLYPSTGIRLLVDAQRGGDTEPEQINLDVEFAQQGGEGPTPYEVLLHAAMIGDSRRFTRQDNIEETWRIMAPLIDKPPRIHPYKPGSWGPKAADRLVADYGGWHGPWIAS